MKLRGIAVAVMVAIGMVGGSLWAQSGTAGTGATAAKTMVVPSKTIDAMYNTFQQEALGAARAMPAEKYSFAPSAGIFVSGQATKFEGVRTFAQQVAHLAQANYGIYATAAGMKPDVDVKAIAAMTNKEDLLKAFETSCTFAHKAIASLTTQNFFESVRGDQTRGELAAFGVAHGFDHYGQMVEYLRMNGIVPPASEPKK